MAGKCWHGDRAYVGCKKKWFIEQSWGLNDKFSGQLLII